MLEVETVDRTQGEMWKGMGEDNRKTRACIFVSKLRVLELVSVQATIRSTIQTKLQCGPMSNVMAAMPNIGGALCSTPKSLADAQYWNAVQ